MRLKKCILILSVSLCAFGLRAQESNEVVQLKEQMQQMQKNFETREQDMEARFEKKITAQDAEIDALKKQVVGASASPPTAPATAESSNRSEVPDMIKELNDKVDSVLASQKKEHPGEFNPAIGVVGETVFGFRSKGSDATGSDRPGGLDIWQRSVELNIAASVDPFAKGWVVANASADSATGEATFGIEEAALQTTSLPWNISLTAGRFFGEFGKLSNIHDHELPFVNRPLALDQFIGGESQSDGLQLNWLPPINHYVSLTLGVGDHFGGDSPHNNVGTYRAFNEFNFWTRLSTYFDLTPNWQLEAGVSGLWNPKTDDRGGVLVQPNGSTQTERARRLAGVDLKISYVPLANNQFRRFDWGTEVLYSDNRYQFDPDGSLNPANPAPGLSGDEFTGNVGSLGLYSYVNYKWSRQWSAGFLFDYIQSAQNHGDATTAYSPFITFALSHWNQLRLQYTHTEPSSISGMKPDDAIYLQWAWIIGAHSHGWSQR